jgi:hypothetical protein
MISALKQIAKYKYRYLEEEINLLQELYFNNAFGTTR